MPAHGNAIPDFDEGGLLGDIKDTKRVSNTAQMRIEREAAQREGKEHVVITGTHTNVSKTVEQAGTRVVRRDDLGPTEPQKP